MNDPRLNPTQVVELYLRRAKKAGPVEGRKVYKDTPRATFSHASNMMGWAHRHGLLTTDVGGDPYRGRVSVTEKGEEWLRKFGTDEDMAADFEIDRLTNE